MNIQVISNGNWLTYIPTIKNRSMKMWIDIKTIPIKDGTYNIFYACEPYVINRHDQILEWILQNWMHFDLVLTHDDRIVSGCPNAKLYHWTSALINENESFEYTNKKFKVSFICGGKLMCEGHFFRRLCWERQSQIKIPSKLFYSTQVTGNLPIYFGNLPLPRNSKYPAFDDSMFHIAMENCIVRGYFSEKIVDCFIAKTLPIYYGCPNIGDFFDIRGIIIVTSVDHIFEIVNNLTEQDFYSRLEYMEINRKISVEKYPINQPKGMSQMLSPLLS